MSLLVPPRRPARELLDDPSLPPQEMAASLRDLDFVNAHWGGGRALERYLLPRMRAAGPGPFVVIDVGAGSGSTTRRLAGAISRAGLPGAVVGVDLQWRHLAAGRSRNGTPSTSSGARLLPALAADAFRLPFRDGGVDWAVSTLVFHHFSPEENRAILRELARVARRGFALLDLRRHLFPWIFVSAAGRFAFESRVSLLDGQTSVRQSYTPEEAQAIARDVVPGARIERVFPYRMLITGPSA